ncbi:NAD(P)/FAD-dependent oxidoreductase [Streptosporangium sp. NPDC049078]|uniref:FAD-dependent oxidoreductase n=1 Tax=Streptosporangium sp. NPDC049078 TaxID=3155767 RepID=UPI0034282614
MTRDDVTVVGGGPIGLLAALGLAQAGIPVTVLEAASNVVRAPRAMIIHWSVLDGLDRLGILDDVLSAGLVQDSWSLRITATGETFRFDLGVLGDEVNRPFNLHLEQDRLAEILLRHATKLPNVTVHWGSRATEVTLDEHGATIVAGGPEGNLRHRTSWVIGADGAHSVVRRGMGLGFPGMTWPESFVATNITYDFAGLGVQRCTGMIDPVDGALVAEIDGEGLWRYTYAESLRLPVEEIAQRIPAALKRALPGGDDIEVHAWSAFRMHERVADRFRVGRGILVGDAAHVTNPSSAVGFAGGFFDVWTLIETLTRVIIDADDPAVLDRYSQLRRQAFTEHASPLSSEFKQFVFNMDDPRRLDREAQRFRRVVGDRDLLRRFLKAGYDTKTPTLRN